VSAPIETPSGYSTPKLGLLRLLKQAPDSSLDEVAQHLGISKVAALGHVQQLEHEGLVERSYRAGHVGRPRVQFRLTARATPLFPQNYSEVSLAALDFIQRKLGPNAVNELLTERAHEVADRARPRLASPDLAVRVRELAQIRTEGGYMAEVGTRRKASIELLEHNCPILALAGRFPIACETERRMFASLLRAEVGVSHRVVAGDPVCRFMVRPAKEPVP
jgi:DeoR family transcriptional regulator, suf operon transcriptional repressor